MNGHMVCFLWLSGIPMTRLSYAIEKLVPALDAGYTSGLTQRGLLQLLWIITKLKPSLKISHLRALVRINVVVLEY